MDIGILEALDRHAPALGGTATALVAVTGFLTYLVTKARLSQDKTEGRSGLVADALALQDAAQTAYEHAEAEAKMARAEFASLRTEIQEIRDELAHWRGIAEAGRDAAVAAGQPIPFWFETYRLKEA